MCFIVTFCIFNFQEGNKVLVVSRYHSTNSTISVLTYLCLKLKLDVRDALRQVKSKRNVLPLFTATQQLTILAKMFNKDRGLGEMDKDAEEN